MASRFSNPLVLVLFLALVSVALALWIGAQTPEGDQPVAEVNGKTISAADLRKAAGQELADLEEQAYRLKDEKLEELIGGKLLALEAERRGVSVEELLDTEVFATVTPVTEEEAEAFYQANRNRLRGEVDELLPAIRRYLEEQRQQAARQAYLASLREQAQVTVYLEPPAAFRHEVSADGAPFRGAADAPVTIVKFEDFHCPFCRRAQPMLKELQLEYGEKLKIAHRDLPLDSIHPAARRAHEAARCAGDQGRFWEYHDLLYEHFGQTEPASLLALAEELGLARAQFQECLDNNTYQAAVQQDVEMAAALGLTGTPSFFINGRLVPGLKSKEEFKRILDQELARQP